MILNRQEVLKQINDIFVEVLDNSSTKINEKSTANDVDGWDSLTHIELVVAIEKHFKIRFSSEQIRSWKNVEEIIDSILSKSVRI